MKRKRDQIDPEKGGESSKSGEGKIVSVVGIGASAGGLEAFSELLKNLPVETGMTHLADSTDDVRYRPYDRTDNVEAAMKDYLTWEMNLVRQIERDDDVNFRAFARV